MHSIAEERGRLAQIVPSPALSRTFSPEFAPGDTYDHRDLLDVQEAAERLNRAVLARFAEEQRLAAHSGLPAIRFGAATVEPLAVGPDGSPWVDAELVLEALGLDNELAAGLSAALTDTHDLHVFGVGRGPHNATVARADELGELLGLPVVCGLGHRPHTWHDPQPVRPVSAQ